MSDAKNVIVVTVARVKQGILFKEYKHYFKQTPLKVVIEGIKEIGKND
jgi:hypothetical protein